MKKANAISVIIILLLIFTLIIQTGCFPIMLAGELFAEESTSSSSSINSDIKTESDTESHDRNIPSTNSVIEKETDSFNGECGIVASAEIEEDILGFPQIIISIENTSQKDIAAIQFYGVPYDVYGEEITGFMVSNRLEYDDLIPAGASEQLSYSLSFMEDTKKMTLYVYSIYFSDGSEWGDRDASTATILKKGAILETQ